MACRSPNSPRCCARAAVSDPERQVSATPASINELAEYAADPRTPDKLVDGVNMTCDDLHVWLAPYTKGAVNRISITLDSVQDLGMLRVWNYNKNRIHSQRGARKVGAAIIKMHSYYVVASSFSY